MKLKCLNQNTTLFRMTIVNLIDSKTFNNRCHTADQNLQETCSKQNYRYKPDKFVNHRSKQRDPAQSGRRH